MKVYISGPITGVEDYKEHFAAAELKLMEAGHIPVNPTKLVNMDFLEEVWIQFKHDNWMGCVTQLLEHCDGIYFLKGWGKSRGCLEEYGMAWGMGMVIMYEEGGNG